MFWTLALAHLIADYPLQTDGLVRAKVRWTGVALHATVHLLVMTILSGRASLRIWPALLALAAAHFTIDMTKSAVGHYRPRQVIVPYVIDQLLHIASLALVAFWIERQFGVQRDQTWMIYAAAYLGATHVWYITERVAAHDDPSYRETVQAHRRLRPVMRGLALTVYLLAGAWLLPESPDTIALFVAASLLLPYRREPFGRRMLAQDLLGPLPIAVLALVLVR